ncbi:4'-phosphopantetheinyl transferase superfamily protein [Cytobacillus kochii]|uniref:4'-phosphopantetheinyl transferase superfamily protein n=1 Tax=Cytobacillus kochii TaxID=859143 RepID=UPI001CD782A6|nr:4'-phosphopantetheinyl transferase superfamily protein [Cytobacillus kochii]MCA1028629.1 4'-phosphopantetheinyl transferase superfamily protein [Cytobacillus kochii]
MIYGLGVDIENISNIDKAYKNTGEMFLKKILTKQEATCNKTIEDLTCYFSGKEAFFKAIGTGILNGYSFTDVEIKKGKGYTLNYNGGLKNFMKSNHLYALLDITCFNDIVISKVIVYKK